MIVLINIKIYVYFWHCRAIAFSSAWLLFSATVLNRFILMYHKMTFINTQKMQMKISTEKWFFYCFNDNDNCTISLMVILHHPTHTTPNLFEWSNRENRRVIFNVKHRFGDINFCSILWIQLTWYASFIITIIHNFLFIHTNLATSCFIIFPLQFQNIGQNSKKTKESITCW